MPTPRVVVADQQLIADGLQRLLVPDFEVAAVVTSGQTLVKTVVELRPDVVTLDFSLPGLDGAEAAAQIRQQAPMVRIVFVTQSDDRGALATALRAGASAYVLKRQSALELRHALRVVVRGKSYVAPEMRDHLPWARGLRSPGSGGMQPSLTARQVQVLQLISAGRTTREIGRRLGISPKTAEFHRACLTETLGIHTTAELTRFAIARGLAGTEPVSVGVLQR